MVCIGSTVLGVNHKLNCRYINFLLYMMLHIKIKPQIHTGPIYYYMYFCFELAQNGMLCMIFYITATWYVKGHPSISSETIISTKQTLFAYFFRRSLHKNETLQNNNGFHLIGATLPPAYQQLNIHSEAKELLKHFKWYFQREFSFFLITSSNLNHWVRREAKGMKKKA